MNGATNAARRILVAAVSLLFILFLGCATARVDWQSRVGIYTYDQTVLELGPPDKVATLSDGTKVGEWIMYRGYPRGGYTTFGGGYYFGGPMIYHYTEPPMPDRFLRLTFGPDDVLQQWRYVSR